MFIMKQRIKLANNWQTNVIDILNKLDISSDNSVMLIAK